MNMFKKHKIFGKGKVLINNELKEIKCASWSLNILPDVNEKLFAGKGEETIEFEGKFEIDKIKRVKATILPDKMDLSSIKIGDWLILSIPGLELDMLVTEKNANGSISVIIFE
jgi:hypothetical protein